MNKPHKHAELIKAWADGAQIEYEAPYSDFDARMRTGKTKWCPIDHPTWCLTKRYRIKPEPPKEPEYSEIARAAWHNDLQLVDYPSAQYRCAWRQAAEAVIDAYLEFHNLPKRVKGA